jgi:predicted Zn-dependent protease
LILTMKDLSAVLKPAVRPWLALTVLSLAALASPAQARDGVDVRNESILTQLVPADQLEAAATQQYAQLVAQARQQGTLLPDNDPQVVRVRGIASRLIPNSFQFNARASQWRWAVVVLKSKELNAFCMPGGKIAVYTGLLDQLHLSDDEVAMVMGHEISHALLEHARERMGKQEATNLGAGLISRMLGLGNLGDSLLNMGAQLLTLKFSRQDETEADLLGMELAARSGYDPHAGIPKCSKAPMETMRSTGSWNFSHPSSSTRILDIESNLPKVMPLYEAAAKPTRRFDGQRN